MSVCETGTGITSTTLPQETGTGITSTTRPQEAGTGITNTTLPQEAGTGITSTTLPQYASAAAGNEDEANPGRPSLCSLPDVVLVLLFKMLHVSDRAHLARTCSMMSAMMHRPSVWSHVTIHPPGTDTDAIVYDEYPQISSIHARDRAMIMKYGQHFKHVRVVLHYGWMARETFNVLSEFGERQILKSLVLRHRKKISKTLYVRRYTPEIGAMCLPCVADLLDTLSPVTHIMLKIHSSSRDFSKLVEFYAQSKSEKCCSLLKTLVLSESQLPERELAEKIDGPPSSVPTAVLISSFPALQVLQLSVYNLSDELLPELSDTSGRRCPLRSLIMTHKCYCTKAPVYPKLSSDAWNKMTLACPALTVECCLMVNYLFTLSDVIKPETPLVKMKVVSTWLYDREELLELCRLCTEHCGTLERFELWVERAMCSISGQEGLKNMVMACPSLRHLLCDVDIDYQHVIDMARDPRQWRTFRFRESRITTHLPTTRMFGALRSKKNLNISSRLRLFAPNEDCVRERQKRLDEMHKVVNTRLGFPM